MFFVFVLSGLFLGWSLGANDAANVYGTAVGTRMIRFRTAAIVCSVFVLLGAVVGGAGASHTLGRLGAVNALAGSFTVALAAALTVTWMTKARLPVSTSQAIVGAIIGWNFFSGSLTDMGSLSRIVSSWVLCPILAAIFAVILLKLAQLLERGSRMHLFKIDAMTRYGLLVAGAFASYSLGANNIANVMGVFVPSAPFGRLDVFGLVSLSAAQQLFFLGAIAIGVGVFTYSRKVMLTVGSELFKLSPVAALIVVLAQAMVLFLFSSEGLESWLVNHGLPTIPLVPVSSSQAVIGAVVGIGLVKGGRNIRFGVLGRIASGWVTTPVAAAAVSFVLLFFVQNVFAQTVFSPVGHAISYEVVVELKTQGLYQEELDPLVGGRFDSAVALRDELRRLGVAPAARERIVGLAELSALQVDIDKLWPDLEDSWFSEEEARAVFRLHGRGFKHAWQLREALGERAEEWRPLPATTANKLHNKQLRAKLEHLERLFAAPGPARAR